MEVSLILLRGLPGAGKTTLAKILSEHHTWPIFSVDDYFTDANTGAYQFKFDDNHLAYKQCLENTSTAMLNKVQKVFVHNTFIFDWEIEPYFKLAKEHAYTVFVVTVENYHKGKNDHSISDEQLKKMAARYKLNLGS